MGSMHFSVLRTGSSDSDMASVDESLGLRKWVKCFLS